MNKKEIIKKLVAGSSAKLVGKKLECDITPVENKDCAVYGPNTKPENFSYVHCAKGYRVWLYEKGFVNESQFVVEPAKLSKWLAEFENGKYTCFIYNN